MSTIPPPPLPPTTDSPRPKRSATLRRIILIFAVIGSGVLVTCQATGVLRAFSAPTAAMEPAITKGDQVMMEGITYLFRKPHRGDLLVFHIDKLNLHSPGLDPKEIFVKRLAGEPGEKLRISGGKLYVNDALVSYTNAKGDIRVIPIGSSCLTKEDETVTVPQGQYLVLGDNAANSFDSRYFGFVPAESVIGRVVFCYLPADRMGWIK